MIVHIDRHLNVFWNYDNNAHLENNITKAIINTIELLPVQQQLRIIKELANIENVDSENVRFEFYLQTKPKHININKIPQENRILLAISPTGKPWGEHLLNLDLTLKNKDTDIIKIMDILSEDKEIENLDEIKKLAEDEYKVIYDIEINHGGSVPDAWIMIYIDEVPTYCIIIENKLYDLNPYQLRNHRKKSLLINDNKETVFKKYDELYQIFKKYDNFTLVVSHFLEYFSLLGYEPIMGFSKKDFDIIEFADEKIKDFYRNLLNKKMLNILNNFINNNYPDNNGYIYETNRLNIIGNESSNIFLNFNTENYILSISTEIGVNSSNISKNILLKLKENSLLKSNISTIYNNSYFLRYIRLNSIRQSLYFLIKKYDQLDLYLNSFNEGEIFIGNIEKSDMINKMHNLAVSDDYTDMKKLINYKYNKWNKLEYLRIIDDINIKDYSDLNDLEKELSEVIEKHIQGIKEFKRILLS